MAERIKQVEDFFLGKKMGNYKECLQNASWDTFCEMSVMREGLLNWYNFRKGSKVLLISNGYGALVDLLCRNTAEVTVLEPVSFRAECIRERCGEYRNLIVTEDWSGQNSCRKSYNYIIIEQSVRTQQELRELLKKYMPLLSKKGQLLFVCENRLGMRYWCGTPDPLTGEPFAGIREKDKAERLTHREISDILNHTDTVAKWKLYYPAPDEKLPQAIYTDEYLPRVSIRDRVISYYTERKSLVAVEDDFCDALIANGVYHIFANSYLVECSNEEDVSNVIFAALSTDRGYEHGFATVITAEGKVMKRSLHSKGWKSLAEICKNAENLLVRGVPCVQQTLSGNAIEMPYIEAPTLIDYLKQNFEMLPEKVEEIFDTLYEQILKSSEHVAFEECGLKAFGVTEEDAGVILREAYIDMIPYNCFYVNGRILFYDQEFVKKNFPAKYVLFRALRYTYIYIPNAEKAVPLQYFKNRYALNSLWDIFEQEEAQFVGSNRNYDTMSTFYQWAKVSDAEIGNNIKRLQGFNLPIEITASKSNFDFEKKIYDIQLYKRDYRLNAVKKVQMQMLKEVMRICEENDLSYCAFYGTLLGVVRHKGYIPWDDDMDIAMPREDYDRFVAIAPEYLADHYFLQTPESDEGCFYGGYSKLRDSRTTAFRTRDEGSNCNKGIWIDIFPLDEVLLDENERNIQWERIIYYQRLIMKKTYPEKRVLCDVSREQETYYLKTSELFTREELCKELHEIMVNFGGKVDGKLTVLARYMGQQERKMYDAEDLEFLIKMPFEDFEILVPVGYERILETDYGRDYMKYPAVEMRKPHHEAFFDTQKSYIDYLSENSYNV